MAMGTQYSCRMRGTHASERRKAVVAVFKRGKLRLELLEHMWHAADGLRLPQSAQLGEELRQILRPEVAMSQQPLQRVLHARLEILSLVCAAVHRKQRP